LSAFLSGLLGWPAVLAACFISFRGLASRRPSWLILSAVLSFPMSLYLAASPRFEFIGLFPPEERVGWLLVTIVWGFFVWLAIALFF